MYLLLWCQCRCFKWKKMTSCFVLCTQDFWKSKEKPFLWLTQLKSSCHSNVRSQLSCFCFILNKLFLLRKMFFCLEVNWRQTFDPFVCSWGVLAAAQILYVLSKKQGDHHFDLSRCVNSEGSLVLPWPPLFAAKGIVCFSVLNLMRKWCCWLARKKPGRAP